MARKGKGKLRNKIKTEETVRPNRVKKYKYLFLIVCEDEKTEPSYFEQFQSKIPKETLYLKPVGTGLDPKGVVERAVDERKKLREIAKKEVDCVWVVFDKDDADENSTKIEKFKEAFDISESESFKVAYSNEVFELWLLIHFIEVDETKPLPRKDVYDLLRDEFKKVEGYEDYEYNHYRIDRRTIEIVFKAGNQEKAIERAALLLEYHAKVGNDTISANPSTKVHLLVKELLDWIKYYSYSP